MPGTESDTTIGRGAVTTALLLLHKLGFELHGADAVDFAVDVVVAVDEADVFDFGADFDHQGRAFDFEVFNHGHGVAVLQHIAHRVFHHFLLFPVVLRGACDGPFVAAFGADVVATVFVGVFRLALGAVR